jgi:hypothetical protein
MKKIFVGVFGLLVLSGVVRTTQTFTTTTTTTTSPAAAASATKPVVTETKLQGMTPSQIKVTEDFMAKALESQLVRRFNVDQGQFYVDGLSWSAAELDKKEDLVRILSRYREGHYKGLPQVTLYDSRSGRELGSYGVFSGVSINTK